MAMTQTQEQEGEFLDPALNVFGNEQLLGQPTPEMIQPPMVEPPPEAAPYNYRQGMGLNGGGGGEVVAPPMEATAAPSQLSQYAPSDSTALGIGGSFATPMMPDSMASFRSPDFISKNAYLGRPNQMVARPRRKGRLDKMNG